MATPRELFSALSELIDHQAKGHANAPTRVVPGYHSSVGLTVTEDGRISHVGTGGSSPLLFVGRVNHTVNTATSEDLDFTATYDPGTLWSSVRFNASSDGWYTFIVDLHGTPTGGNITAGDIFDLTLNADGTSFRLAHFEAYNTPASTPAYIQLIGTQTAQMSAGSHATIYAENLTTRNVQFTSGNHCSLTVLKVA